MVEQTEDGKYKSADDRICPCKPAINDEVPNKGMCHCGIFCSEEFANKTSQNNTPQEVEEIVEVDENQAKETLQNILKFDFTKINGTDTKAKEIIKNVLTNDQVINAILTNGDQGLANSTKLLTSILKDMKVDDKYIKDMFGI